MDATRRSMSRDYTQSLAWPIRALHAVAGVLSPLTSWACDARRRDWAVPLLVGLIGGVLLFPFDGLVAEWARSVRLGGDVRRELEALQQYGQLSVSLIAACAMALLDPARTRRLLDWGAALLLTTVTGLVLKVMLGRPRPVYDEPGVLLGPVGARPIPSGEAVVRPFEVSAPSVSSLWSMPSSHTAAAVVMSVFLGMMYPRLRVLAALLAGVVGFGRILTGAHYPSDVLVGACLGGGLTAVCVSRGWGVRAIDWLWRVLVDRNASPAWPMDHPGP